MDRAAVENFPCDVTFGGVCFMANDNMCTGSEKGSPAAYLDRKEHAAAPGAAPPTKSFNIAGEVRGRRAFATAGASHGQVQRDVPRHALSRRENRS